MSQSSQASLEERRAADACPCEEEASLRMEDEGCPNQSDVRPKEFVQ